MKTAKLKFSVEDRRRALAESDVKWVVNSEGELGVMIHDQLFFCYKAHSLCYGVDDTQEPIMYRAVDKREFGESIRSPRWDVEMSRKERLAKLGNSEDLWRKIPARQRP